MVLNRVIDFLSKNYLNPTIQKTIEAKYEIEKPKTNQKTPEQIKIEQKELQKYHDKNMLIFLFWLGLVLIFVFLFSNSFKN